MHAIEASWSQAPAPADATPMAAHRSNLYTLSNYLAIDLAEKRRRAAWLAHVQKVVFDPLRLPAGASGATN